MEATVEFNLEGTLCRVVPDDGVAGSASQSPGRGGRAVGQVEERVVGNCQLDGRRYGRPHRLGAGPSGLGGVGVSAPRRIGEGFIG